MTAVKPAARQLPLRVDSSQSSRGTKRLIWTTLSCSPFQAAGANIPLLAIERFKSTAVRQGKRHDHENDG